MPPRHPRRIRRARTSTVEDGSPGRFRPAAPAVRAQPTRTRGHDVAVTRAGQAGVDMPDGHERAGATADRDGTPSSPGAGPAAAIVLAAGAGSRMRSAVPKVLHTMGGRSLLGHAVHAVAGLDAQHLVVVVGHEREQVRAALAGTADELGHEVLTAVQEQRLGTGDAVRCGTTALPADLRGTVLVTYGDVPAARHPHPGRAGRGARVVVGRGHPGHHRPRRPERLRPHPARRRQRRARHRRAPRRDPRAARHHRDQLRCVRLRRRVPDRRAGRAERAQRAAGALPHRPGGRRRRRRTGGAHRALHRRVAAARRQRPRPARRGARGAEPPRPRARDAGRRDRRRPRDDLGGRPGLPRRRRRPAPGHAAARPHPRRRRRGDRPGHHADRLRDRRRSGRRPHARLPLGDRRGRVRRPVRLPAPGRPPRRQGQDRHVRRGQELRHRRRHEGAAPDLRRRRHDRRDEQHRRRVGVRQLRRRAQAAHGRRLARADRLGHDVHRPGPGRRRRVHRRRDRAARRRPARCPRRLRRPAAHDRGLGRPQATRDGRGRGRSAGVVGRRPRPVHARAERRGCSTDHRQRGRAARTRSRARRGDRRRHPPRRHDTVSAISATPKKNMMLFSGRAHLELAEHVAKELNVTVTPQSATSTPSWSRPTSSTSRRTSRSPWRAAEIGTQYLAGELRLPNGVELRTDAEYLVLQVIPAPTEEELEAEIDTEGAGVVEDPSDEEEAAEAAEAAEGESSDASSSEGSSEDESAPPRADDHGCRPRSGGRARQPGPRVRRDPAQRRLPRRRTPGDEGRRPVHLAQALELRRRTGTPGRPPGDTGQAADVHERLRRAGGRSGQLLLGARGGGRRRARRPRPRVRRDPAQARWRRGRAQRPALDQPLARDEGLPAGPVRHRPSAGPAGPRRLRAQALRRGRAQGAGVRGRPGRGRRRGSAVRRPRTGPEPVAGGGAAELARRRLRQAPRREDRDLGGAHPDRGHHAGDDLGADRLRDVGVVRLAGLHRDGERLAVPVRARGQTHGDDVAGPHPVGLAGGALDVGRVDVAPAHDDHVLAPAADDDRAGLGQVALVAGVEPALGVLGGDRPVDGQVAGRHGLSAQLQHPDLARPAHRTLAVDDPDLDPGQRRPELGERPRRAVGRGGGAAVQLQGLGVDDVGAQPRLHRRERHPERGLGHAVGAQHRLRAQPEPGTGVGERGDGDRVDRLGAVERDPQRRQVQRTVVDAGELAGQHGVGEVRGGGDGRGVLRDQLGPQPRAAEELGRGHRDQVQADRHRHGQEPDHPHVVEQRQPGHHPVALDVEARGLDHPGDVGVQVAVRDPDGLGRRGGPAGQLQQRGVVLAGDVGLGGERVRVAVEGVDRAERDALLGQDRRERVERRSEQHHPRVDHAQDLDRVRRPDGQVGARGRLVQHRDAAAAEPDGLRDRRDRGRLPRQHTHRTAGGQARHTVAAPAQRVRPSAGDAVDLRPGTVHRVVRLPGGHAPGTRPGPVTVHGRRAEPAADSSIFARKRDIPGSLATIAGSGAANRSAAPVGCDPAGVASGDVSQPQTPPAPPAALADAVTRVLPGARTPTSSRSCRIRASGPTRRTPRTPGAAPTPSPSWPGPPERSRCRCSARPAAPRPSSRTGRPRPGRRP
ncbi:hypothetical protein L7F22_020963 [Adiantum nelumboides]|nr:hypothetical protein [Adiantum nelumboides]